jgi:hypothetical protein
MASLTAVAPVDMTDWNFGNIKNGVITGHTANRYLITGADGQSFYQFTGVNLTYDASFHLTGGTVTGYKVLDAGGDTLFSIGGMSLAATTLKSAINTSDSGGTFENAVFSGNDTITGSAHDDVLTGLAGTNTIDGGDGDDVIDSSLGVVDTINGGNGDDTLYLGANLLVGSIDGGAGTDTVVWNMDLTLQASLGSTFTNFEQLLLLGGPEYNLKFYDSFLAAGQHFKIDGSSLGGGSKLLLDASDELDGNIEFVLGAGNDRVWGGQGQNSFDLTRGGGDRVHGGSGANFYYLGNTLTLNDRIVGSAGGQDNVFLDGDYSAGLTFGPRTLVDIDELFLAPGHSYSFTENDANLSAGQTMILFSIGIGAANTVFFDGSAETDGGFTLSDGLGNDTLIGGQSDDGLVSAGGTDILTGNAGDDVLTFDGGTLDASDTLDGGTGFDELDVQGDYSAGVVFGATTLQRVELLRAADHSDYNFTTNDANVGAGKTFIVEASALTAGSQMIFDGSAELDGFFEFRGGAGDDSFKGSAHHDQFTGGLGADFLAGGGGQDVFVYAAAAESTSRGFDTVDGFDALQDKFQTGGVVAIDPEVTTGPLRDATFDTDLATAIDAGHLLAGDAVLFKPSGGDHAGQLFLIVDHNATAGYQAGDDLVILLTNATHLASLSTGNFI